MGEAFFFKLCAHAAGGAECCQYRRGDRCNHLDDELNGFLFCHG